MAISEEDFSISVQKYTVLFDKGHKELKLPEKFSSIRHLKVETNAPEICLSKFVILIQALLILFLFLCRCCIFTMATTSS